MNYLIAANSNNDYVISDDDFSIHECDKEHPFNDDRTVSLLGKDINYKKRMIGSKDHKVCIWPTNAADSVKFRAGYVIYNVQLQICNESQQILLNDEPIIEFEAENEDLENSKLGLQYIFKYKDFYFARMTFGLINFTIVFDLAGGYVTTMIVSDSDICVKVLKPGDEKLTDRYNISIFAI